MPQPTRHDFDDAQVDLAIQTVADQGAKDRGQTVSYSRVFEAAGLPAPQLLHQGSESHLVTEFMKAFHDRCLDRDLPPLDSLVVHVAGQRQGWPGAGYFKVNGLQDPKADRASAEDQVKATIFWESEKDQCKRWGTAERRAGR